MNIYKRKAIKPNILYLFSVKKGEMRQHFTFIVPWDNGESGMAFVTDQPIFGMPGDLNCIIYLQNDPATDKMYTIIESNKKIKFSIRKLKI